MVKVYYPPGELAARLAELGWSAEIRETSIRLPVGTARRTSGLYRASGCSGAFGTDMTERNAMLRLPPRRIARAGYWLGLRVVLVVVAVTPG